MPVHIQDPDPVSFFWSQWGKNEIPLRDPLRVFPQRFPAPPSSSQAPTFLCTVHFKPLHHPTLPDFLTPCVCVCVCARCVWYRLLLPTCVYVCATACYSLPKCVCMCVLLPAPAYLSVLLPTTASNAYPQSVPSKCKSKQEEERKGVWMM